MIKKYQVQVVMSYFHTIDVEASSVEEAEAVAFDLFDVAQAYPGDGEICWTTCIDAEEQTS